MPRVCFQHECKRRCILDFARVDSPIRHWGDFKSHGATGKAGSMQKLPLIGVVLIVVLLCPSACARPEPEPPTTIADDDEWKQKVNTEVNFPLDEQIAVTVWYSANPQGPTLGPENVSLQWLQEQTNIVCEFIPVDRGAEPYWGETTFPEAVNAGKLPDLMQESLLPQKDASTRALLVDFLEFPKLTPNFRRLLEQDQLFLHGTLGRLEGEGALCSLGSYRRDARPFLGAFAYRQDLFDTYGLRNETWDELFESLRHLKQQHPDSYPFALTSDALFHQMPSWFATGFDRLYGWYYHPDKREWIIGPFEESYEEFVRYFAELNREQLLHPYTLTPPPEQDYLTRALAEDRVFVTPWPGMTGLAFKPLFESFDVEYGDLTEAGDWNRQGAWISAMRLPQNDSGQRGWIGPTRWTSVHSGWLINKQSEYVGELVALLDYAYDRETALSLQFGPEGKAWIRDDADSPVLKPFVENPYAYLRESDVIVGLPLQSQLLDYRVVFDLKQTPMNLYFEKRDVAFYFGESGVITMPAPLVDYKAILNEPAMLIILNRVMRYVNDEVVGFVTGDRPLDEYDDFRKELTRMGAEKLLAYLQQHSIVLDESLLGL